MGRDTHIDELLSQHEAAQAGGQPLSPEELCRDCPDLLDDLKRRLADLEWMNTLLTSRPDRANPGAGAQDIAPAGEPPLVAGCEIIRELGRGGMGVVYQVWQTRLGRMAALKMICAGACASPGERARFLTEAAAAARVQHPHIVQVYELGEHNGQPYLLLEFVEGDSLAHKLAATPLPVRQAAQLIETLARAMHHAHGRGVVHRDLKPANVLLTADGTPKITDFGLAKLTIGGNGHTLSGAILGTPSYMAPEQAAGQVSRMGPATDIYALGAILYELLTGRPPFRGATTVDTLQQVQHLDPVPPRRLQPRVPRDLETICLKCLEKEPRQRYASAADPAEDLRRFLEGETISARPSGRAERAVKWARRHPALAVLLVAALALLLGLVGHTIQRQHDYELVKSERDRAQAAEALARRREAEAQVARYAARTRLASQLFNAGDVFGLPGQLDLSAKLDGTGDDPRDFAWWYLRQYRQESRPALAAHEGPIRFLAYSADGRWLVTAGRDRDGRGRDGETLRVRNLDEAEPHWQRDLPEPGDGGTCSFAAFAPGGARLAAIGRDGTVSLWDVGTGAERLRLSSRDVFRVALSPDGRWLATGGSGPLAVWDTATGKQKLTVPAALGPLAFVPDGRTLVVGGNSDAFRGLEWWDLATGKRLGEGRTEAGVVDLSCSRGGTYLVVRLGDSRGEIWHARERVPLFWPQAIGAVATLAISPDERTVATGDEDGNVRLWDVPTLRLRTRYRWQANPILRLAFSPDGRTLAAANSEGLVYQMDATARTVPESLQRDLARADRAPVWSPDGRTLAVGFFDRTVQLIDARSRRVRASLQCSPLYSLNAMAFSPDGRTLATFALGERVVRLWDTAAGRSKGVTAVHASPVESVAFSPDGRRLATADSTTVRLWDMPALTERGVLGNGFHRDQVAFTPDGHFLVTAGEGGVQVWDLSSGQLPRQPRCFARVEHGVSRLAIAPDGRRVATGGRSAMVEFWQLARDGQLTRDLPPRCCGGKVQSDPGRVLGLQFGPGETTLLTTLESGSADLWDMPSGRHRVKVGAGLLFGALSPDGNTLATIGGKGVLQFWDLRTWRVSRPPGQHLEPVTSLAFLPDGTLVTGSALPVRLVNGRDWVIKYESAPLGEAAETVRFWNVATGQEIGLSDLPSQEMMAPPSLLACSPDGRIVAAGSEDGSIWLWDRSRRTWLDRLFVSDACRDYAGLVEPARALWPITNPDYAKRSEAVQALAFSPDGRWLAAAGNRGSVRIWKAGDWKAPWALPYTRRGVAWLAFTPDSTRLATGQGGAVRLWDATTGELRATFGLPEDSPMLCGAFAPDGRLLATGSKDRTIRLWNPDTGKVSGRLVGHMDRVTALAFTPDGKTLASGGWDRSVRLWSVAAAEEVALLEGHTGKVQTLAFSPDGQVLVSGSGGSNDTGEVLLWRARHY